MVGVPADGYIPDLCQGGVAYVQNTASSVAFRKTAKDEGSVACAPGDPPVFTTPNHPTLLQGEADELEDINQNIVV